MAWFAPQSELEQGHPTIHSSRECRSCPDEAIVINRDDYTRSHICIVCRRRDGDLQTGFGPHETLEQMDPAEVSRYV